MIDESVVRGVSQCLVESAAVPLLLYHLARSQDFLLEGVGVGGGGCTYLKNRDQIINIWIIRHGTSEVTRWHSVQPTDY